MRPENAHPQPEETTMSETDLSEICPLCRRSLPARAPTAEPALDLARRVELIENEDYEGLVRYFEKLVAARPDDAYAVRDLGEAHVLNGDPERALEILERLHARVPRDETIHWVILDALYALGRDERDFDWRYRVRVVHLGDAVLDACAGYLRRERRTRYAEDLYWALLRVGYCAFSVEDLVAALAEDRRFAIEDEVYSVLGPEVRLRDLPA